MSLKQLIYNPFQLVYNHLFSFGLVVILIFGWIHRDDNYLSAETGAGYLLGIVGGSLMLVLLLYPLSKRVALLTRFIPVRYWFGIHMLLGIVGPVLILFHSNFQTGSTNSTVALICMLLVAGSGIIGRYIYTNIHHGLYGTRVTLNELKLKTENDHAEFLRLFAKDKRLNSQLEKMEEKALRPYTSLTKSVLHAIYLAVNARRFNRKVQRLLKNSYRETNENTPLPDNKELAHLIDHYTLALRKTAAFKVYERLFSLWHILHLPLFFLMIITAVIHIFAVHMY
ncbi:MAG: pyridine nucleotide-disulfide oxidoreductase [Proteobacteria bacterium]|nr:pyridine nucleotide-disulfide oxidoreductase [Pseudomonadota bacterium]